MVKTAKRRAGAPRRHAIATRNEGPLHAALKAWYRQPGDRVEAPVDGRQADLARGDLVIEIQTRGLGALKKKLAALTEKRSVRLVHPIAQERWVVRVDRNGHVLGRRKSPRRGRLEDAFFELVSLPHFFAKPRFTFEVLLTREEEVRRHEAGRAWRRRGWVVVERRLIDVVSSHVLRDASDLRGLLPPGLPAPFTTADLAERLFASRPLAQKMAYCLREAGAIEAQGKKGNALLYSVCD